MARYVSELVGRAAEQTRLGRALQSKEPELVAIYGRRRVGKTFLIRQFFGERICFELTGAHDAAHREQLGNFARALGRAAGMTLTPSAPASWGDAFDQLVRFLERLPPAKAKRVVFIDELPWLASRRSGFLSAFEHFWNAWASGRPEVLVVVCGSAASWMTQKLLRAKGGLHNRVTHAIHLQPFRLREVREYLEFRHVKLSDDQLFELYMALGGVPHYLRQVEPGRSAAENVDRLCFALDGPLRDEFPQLYGSLFEHSERHEGIVRTLAKQRSGVTRPTLLASSGLASGGGVTKTLDELEASGFIRRSHPFGRESKESTYRLVDEYSLFYLRWIEGSRSRGPNTWLSRRGTPAWRAWSGYAFESLCIQHVMELKRALGIEAVETQESSWHRAGTDEPGAQVDLLIDRRDDCVNLCEMKFSENPFLIDRRYAGELVRKVEVFRRSTATRKAVFLTMVTSSGVRDNQHKRDTVHTTVDAMDFLR